MASTVTFQLSVDPKSPDQPTIYCAVNLPIADVRPQANKLGIAEAREEIRQACKASHQYQHYEALQSQIAAAEAKVAGAEQIFEQVKAAKLLLETQPVPSLAEKLRLITAQLAQAEEDKASAEADLAQIHGLRQKHWLAAANSLLYSGAPPKFTALMAQRDKARAELEAACANVQELLRKAVAASIEPLAADLAVLNNAVNNWHQRVGEVKEGVFAELMGTKPSGVIKNGHRYQLAATPQPIHAS